MSAWLLAIALRATALLLSALAAWCLTRRASAALRHAIVFAGVCGSLLIPALTFIAPPAIVVSDAAPSVIRAAAAPATQIRERYAASQAPRSNAAAIPVAIWLAGAILLGCRALGSVAAAERLRRHVMRTARAQTGLVYVTDAIASAATVGIIRPIVLIADREWDPNDRRAAIAHELAHVARRDTLTQAIAALARATYWFHPLMWISTRVIALEQERACDEAVLRSGFAPSSYAALLLALASVGRPAFATPIASGRSRELATRLRGIVGARRGAVRRTSMAAVVACAFAAATLSAMTARLAPIDDPLSERLPEVAAIAEVAQPATPDDAMLARLLLTEAKKPKTWEGDLVAERARWALQHAVGGAVLQPLRDALDDSDWRVRAYAAWALAQAGDRVAVPRLVELMSDSVWRMRAMAAFALRAAADPRAAQAMQRALDDPAWQVRTEAVGYFGDMHQTKPIERMTADPHSAVRGAAEEALRSQ